MNAYWVRRIRLAMAYDYDELVSLKQKTYRLLLSKSSQKFLYRRDVIMRAISPCAFLCSDFPAVSSLRMNAHWVRRIWVAMALDGDELFSLRQKNLCSPPTNKTFTETSLPSRCHHVSHFSLCVCVLWFPRGFFVRMNAHFVIRIRVAMAYEYIGIASAIAAIRSTAQK